MKWDIRRLREAPELCETAACWFSERWKIPVSEYTESIEECIAQENSVPQWYLVQKEDGQILAGAGVIENDFHTRKDLCPNVCAVFVEEAVRRQGIARMLLNEIRRDMAAMGVLQLYLLTDHDAFYEKCGWRFLEMVRDDTDHIGRMYVADTENPSGLIRAKD